MSSAEPLGVAFIEIEPIAPAFRAKTEAQVRSALVGSAAGTTALTTATTGLTAAETRGTVAAQGKAIAEREAAAATHAHATAAGRATEAVIAETASLAGLRGHSLGITPAFIGATAAVIAFFKSLEEADRFAESMHQIEVATHASEEAMAEARSTALGLGHDLSIPLTSANDAADAINFLARSGFDLDDSLTAARGALLLSAASTEDLETSVRNLDRILDAFNLTASDSERVADAVATGLKFTQGNATEFANALATVAPAADLMGLSLEDTNTLVLQLAESGLSAGQAAGSLRQALLRLATATGPQGKQIREALHEINLEVSDLIDQSGSLRPDAFVRLADALDSVSERQQKAILIQLFTRRAALGVLRIIDQQAEGYRRMSERARESGVAQEEAEARTRSFGGQMAELRDDVADLGVKFGTLTEGPITQFVKQLRGIAREGDRALTVVTFLAGGIGGLGIAAAGAFGPLDQLIDRLKQVAALERDPVGGALGFLKDIPGEIKDAASGLQQAINLNVKGIADIPGIREISENLNLLVGAWEKAQTGSKDHIDQINRDAKTGMDQLDRTTKDGANRVAGNLAQISLDVARAQVSGDQQAELDALRRQRAGHLNLFNRLNATAARSPTKDHIDAAKRAAALVAADDAAISAILSERESDARAAASDAKAKADKIEKAADERDANFIRAIETRRAAREAAVSIAAADEAIQNDIRADIKLRNFLRNAIAATRARIRQARAAGRDTEALAAELANLRRARNQVRREIEDLQRQAAEQAAETRVENAQLDLQILEARFGDDPNAAQTNALVRAHQKVIAALKKAQSLTKKRSVEWKRLQVEIEQEKAAIRDLRNATSEGGANFSQLSFQFLQDQQGILQNFGPNFFPSGALTVGGSANQPSPTIRLPRLRGQPVPGPFDVGGKGGARTATTPTGITHGQANELVHQMRILVQEMRLLRKGAGHPSNKHSATYNRHLSDHH